MFRRLAYAVFFVCGGFLFAIPKWIMFGSRASRDRREMIQLLKQQQRR